MKSLDNPKLKLCRVFTLAGNRNCRSVDMRVARDLVKA